MAEQWSESWHDHHAEPTLEYVREAVERFDELNYDEERAGVLELASEYLFDAGNEELGELGYRTAEQHRRLSSDVAGEFVPDGELAQNTNRVLDHFRNAKDV